MSGFSTNSKIKSHLRNLWLRSPERAAAMKRDNYTCQKCHRKQTMAKGKEFKVQVHHLHGIGNWDKVCEIIKQELLCDPEFLQTLCKECHDQVENEMG
jgi:5-methylcytosine-specific restriction endonuclease McrA